MLGTRLIRGFGASVVCPPSKKFLIKKIARDYSLASALALGLEPRRLLHPRVFKTRRLTNYHKPANTRRLRILYFKVLEPAHRQMHGYGMVTALHIRSLYILKRLLVRSSVTTHHYA